MNTTEHWQGPAMQTRNNVDESQRRHTEYKKQVLTVASYTVLFM